MKSNLLIILLLSFTNLYAQKNIEKIFFSHLFKNNTTKVTYSEYRFYDLNEMKNMITHAKVIHKMQSEHLPKILIDSLSFTNQELDTVYNKIASSNDKHWAKNLISNGKYIPRKKVNEILKNKSKGWKYFHEKYSEYLCSISKPALIRNNTVCFIYLSCGNGDLGGIGSFDIYIKQNEEWILFNSLRLCIG